MASLKIKFRESRVLNKKGSCYIQLIHERKMKTLSTHSKIYTNEWNDTESRIDIENASPERLQELQIINESLLQTVSDLEKVIENLERERSVFTVDDILHAYRNYSFRGSFFALIRYRISCFRAKGKKSTANNYQCAFNSFVAFRENRDLNLQEITSNLMKDFEIYLQEKGIGLNTSSLYIRTLRATYNYAIDEELIVINKKPFKKVFTGEEKTEKRAVKGNVIQDLLNLNLERKPLLALARDMFMFSIYMRGMAFVDIAHLCRNNIKGGYLSYKRHKTGQSLQIYVLPCAQAIIDKYKLIMKDSPLLFPILFHPGRSKFTLYDTALRIHNRRLQDLADYLGLETSLSSYVARHTWATLAKWSGIPDTVISEAMGHTSCETTRIYLDSFDKDVINNANMVVASVLQYSVKIKV